MNLHITIEELSLPQGGTAAEFEQQIAAAIDSHLNQHSSELFGTSNASESIRENVANVTWGKLSGDK